MGLKRADIQMTTKELDTYYDAAAENIFGPGAPFSGSSLDKALGVSIYTDWCNRSSYDDKLMPEDWIEFLKQLAGPYGKAILKAYQIKYGVEHADIDG